MTVRRPTGLIAGSGRLNTGTLPGPCATDRCQHALVRHPDRQACRVQGCGCRSYRTMTALEAAAWAMPERGRGGLEEAAEQILRDLDKQVPGWGRWYHTHTSKFSPSGFPDLTVVSWRTGMGLVSELKKMGEDPSPDQEEWLRGFTATGYLTRVFRPVNLQSGEVAETIAYVALGTPCRWVHPSELARRVSP